MQASNDNYHTESEKLKAKVKELVRIYSHKWHTSGIRLVQIKPTSKMAKR